MKAERLGGIWDDDGLKIPAYTLIETINEMVQIIIKRLQ